MKNAADLFAGLGGLTCGAELSGLAQVKLAANHNADAIAWHERNHPDVEHVCQDLAEFDWTRLPELDAGVLLAAPACQGFSEAGQPAKAGTGGSHAPDPKRLQAKHQRDRNTTWAVIAAADSARPQTIVVENVPRLLRWPIFPAWRACLEAMGYHVTTQLLNARDFGAAQDRERLILVADQRRAIEIVAPQVERAQVGALLLDDDHHGHRWAEIDAKPERMRIRIRKAQREAGARCLWNNVSESRGRELEGLAPTLTTKSGSQLCLVDGDRIRTLDPRELARIQGFPDTYEIPANRKTASLLIGNATPVQMAQSVIQQVAA